MLVYCSARSMLEERQSCITSCRSSIFLPVTRIISSMMAASGFAETGSFALSSDEGLSLVFAFCFFSSNTLSPNVSPLITSVRFPSEIPILIFFVEPEGNKNINKKLS